MPSAPLFRNSAALYALLIAPATIAQVSLDGVRAKQQEQLQNLLTGHFTNEEQVYFEGETKQPLSPRGGMRAERSADGGLNLQFLGPKDETVGPMIALRAAGLSLASASCANVYDQLGDAFVLNEKASRCAWKGPRIEHVSAHGVIMRAPDGRVLDYRRARSFTCWLSAPKAAPKLDGSIDWFYAGKLKLHDQGGRVWVESPELEAKRVGYKLRNVVWPYGSNKPALTLYIYRGEDESKAVSYAWTDPEAKLIGINLRWVQGSCSRD
jgi:hypothetical protein